MAKMSLKEWINSKQKAKGLSTSEAKKSAGKYKSISAAKKAGSLYYTNKDGKTMIAATASDLSAPAKKSGSVKTSLRPKLRPKSDVSGITTPRVTTTKLSNTKGGRGDGVIEMATRALDKNKASRGQVPPSTGTPKFNGVTFKEYLSIVNNNAIKRLAFGLPSGLSQAEFNKKAKKQMDKANILDKTDNAKARRKR
tara:strand:+ start:1082 stop:1669 length:588 start_codon:yes stop_codon:yes gene_type:complete